MTKHLEFMTSGVATLSNVSFKVSAHALVLKGERPPLPASRALSRRGSVWMIRTAVRGRGARGAGI